MRKLRKVAVLGLATAVAAIGLVACGGGSSSSSSGKEGGEINGTVTSFPDYLDPQLSYTLEGWEGLWNVYVPLLTYQHGNGDETTKVVPGLAESLPTISPDGKTYTLTLRKGMKYSDGTPIVASDFPYAIQRLFKLDSGGAPFFENIVGAEDYANGKANSISGIQADDKTGKITIQLLQPSGTFNNELGLMFAAPVPKSTPLDKDQTNTPPPASGPLMITNVDAPNSYTEERNPQFKTVQAAGAERCAGRTRRQDHGHAEQEPVGSGDRDRAEHERFHGRSATGGPAAADREPVLGSVPLRGFDQHVLLLL